MSLEYIFPDHTKRNRHIAIVVECVAAAVALALGFWAISHYWTPKEDKVQVVTTPEVDYMVKQREILNKPGPTVTFTPQKTMELREVLNKPGSAVKFDSRQTQEMRTVLLEEGI